MKILAVLLSILAAGPVLGQVADPRLWPDEQRAFFQDGPGLLLDDAQRAAFLTLDEAGRTAFIAGFLDRDPIPETSQNELREGIDRRSRLAALEFVSPQDARAQLLFLQGRPANREVIDCGSAFKPMEIWTWGVAPVERSLIVYQPSPDEPFRLWLPIDSKAALYTKDMLNWLEQWEMIGMGGKRIDRRFCPSSEDVDRVTGIDGVRGRLVGTATHAVHNPLADEPDRIERRDFRWSRPQDRARLRARPASLAAWAREAAATPLPPAAPRLAIDRFDLDFPSWQGQRLVVRTLLFVSPGEAKAFTTAADGHGPPRVRLSVDGVLEGEDRIFETFRMRYRLEPPGAETPAALFLEHPLRPGRTFLLRLRIRDEGNGAQALITRGVRVPEAPVATLKEEAKAAVTGEVQPLHIAGKDSLLLLPPMGEVMLGVWRAETLVTGDCIEKVVFLVDGEAQLSRTRPPFAAEVRLSPFPREQIVRVEGFDASGALVASDELVLNQARGAFRVAIAEPKASSRPALRPGSKATVQAEVVVPEEGRLAHVELRLDDILVSTKTAPPWQWEVDVPAGDVVYVAVTAELEDGTRQEAVRFLRAPENMENVDVDLVELYTTVTDGQGQIVRGLTADDFEVQEAGKPQKLAKFELVENLPLTLGFVIDTSISMATSLVEAERAAKDLLHNIMTPRDRAFAIGFSAQPYLLLPPTDDVEGLSEALDTLRAHSRTAIFDALVTGLYYLRSTKGQRALILLSDGDDNSSSTPWATALEYAKRSGVAVYCVGLNVPLLDREARSRLTELSTSTGGRVYFVGHAEELTSVYGQIEQELRSRYLLAYNSDRPAEDEGFRPVEVKVKHGLKARTARGYYP